MYKLKELDKQQQKRSQEDTDMYNTIKCPECGSEIMYEQLLNAYGPEGLYRIAKKLIEIADEDYMNALSQFNDCNK